MHGAVKARRCIINAGLFLLLLGYRVFQVDALRDVFHDYDDIVVFQFLLPDLDEAKPTLGWDY